MYPSPRLDVVNQLFDSMMNYPNENTESVDYVKNVKIEYLRNKMTCPFCTNSDDRMIETKNVTKFIDGILVKLIICDCQVCSKRWVIRELDETNKEIK